MKRLKELLCPWAYWHSQNLNERRVGDETETGSMLREGRFWFNYGKRANVDREIPPHKVKLGWIVFSRRIGFGFGLHFEIEDGHEVTAHFSIPFLLTLYVSHSVPMRWLKRILPLYTYRHTVANGKVMEGSYHLDRCVGVSTLGDWFQWQFWAHPNGGWYDLSDHAPLPWWREFSFFWKDVLFGRTRCETEVLTEPHPVQIPMPEGNYPATLKVERCTWTRARSPFKKVRVTRDIECDYGIPFPGKGENSWDCGDDAIHGTGFEVSSDEEAITRFAGVALKNRRRYGGPDCASQPWPESPEDRILRIDAARAAVAAERQTLHAAPEEPR